MNKKNLHLILTILIGSIWIINGLFCKILDWIPRHQEIIGQILGHDFSRLFTVLIGCGEVLLALWIFSRYNSRLNAYFQVFLVGLMNLIEFLMVPDLLLWGRMNSIFALLFICIVLINEYVINPNHGLRMIK